MYYSSYIPQAGPKVETERVMAAPHFRGVGIEHNNNFQPDLVQKPGDPIMVGPKLPNIDYSHHYGPVPPKVDDPYKNFS